MNLQTILIFFIIAAVGGITMAVLVFKNKRRPILLVALHGIVALGGFGALVYYSGISFQTGHSKTPWGSLAFFSIAIAGGLLMFFRDKYMKVGIKKWMPLVHGSAALIGIILLLFAL